MSFQVFKKIVETICARSGGGITPLFSEEDGRYIAQYDDIEITGNSQSVRLTARWGSGKCHQAMIPKEVCSGAV